MSQDYKRGEASYILDTCIYHKKEEEHKCSPMNYTT